MERMKAQLNGVVDINYKRYNNKYMDYASEHMKALKRDKDARKEKSTMEIAGEAADHLYPVFNGRSIL